MARYNRSVRRRSRRRRQRQTEYRRTGGLTKLLIMLAVVAAIVLGVAIFFRVHTVEIQGNTIYSSEQVVKASGVEFAIIRVGYRGYGNGALMADENAQINYQNAKAAGLKIGAYLFSQAISVEEAQEEAAFFLEQIKDWELDLWAVYDWEYISAEARTANVDALTLTKCTKAFLDAVAEVGHQPMVYFNRSQSEKRLFMNTLAGYDFWLAMYHDPIDTFAHRPDMWQYTNTGRVPGINGNVDINLWFPWQ